MNPRRAAPAAARRPTPPKAVPVPSARHLRALKAPRPVVRQNAGVDLRLRLSLAVSLAVHALILAVTFSLPIDERLVKDKPLEVVLVNARTKGRPQDPLALAQANLDGGGNTDDNRRASTPLPASQQKKEGDQLESAMQRVRELEARQRMLIAQARAEQAIAAAQPTREAQPQPTPQVSGLDLASNAMAMARLQAQIDRTVDEYNKRPRKKFIGARTEEYRFAQYVEDWRNKVERIGTLNYPEAARGKLYGNLILTVVVRSDGNVENVEINRSSGHKVLDEAARRIVQMAGPYPAFPPEIRRDTDVLEITRTWFFTRDEAVRAN